MNSHCSGWDFYIILPVVLIKLFGNIYKPLEKELLSFEPQSKAFYGENGKIMPVFTSVMID